MEGFFKLEKSVQVSISTGQGGKVKLNNLTLTNEDFTGSYYPDQNIELTAIPYDDFTFSHWTGTVESRNPNLFLNPADTISVEAVFSRL